tara:strand:+ start:16269 stop:17120 length:852 start_codon:yes stop_codon:yes gene_type:complete
MNKIAIGTVQFGMNYGINNQIGIPKNKEISNILKFAHMNGIDTLDTAISYGNSEKKIGQLKENFFKIVTKFSGINNFSDLENELSKSLSQLQVEKLYGFIFHNVNDLINNPEIWNFLAKLKALNKVEKIGFSLYNEHQLNKILNLGIIPDLVQLPYSILDRSLESSLIKLKQYNVETHIRSVFLQGLYFRNPNSLPEKILPLKPYLEKLHKICSENNISMSQLALNFVRQNKNIDKVIIGSDSVDQLRENSSAMNYNLEPKLIKSVQEINVKEKELLNPINWN